MCILLSSPFGAGLGCCLIWYQRQRSSSTLKIMKTQNSMIPYRKFLESVSLFAFSLGSLTCLPNRVVAADFHADISNFSLVMPAAITNKFGFSLSIANTRTANGGLPIRGDADFSEENAFAIYNPFTIEHTSQPSGLLPPFSDTRSVRRVSNGSVDGFADPEGWSWAYSQAVLFGTLGNFTGSNFPFIPPPEDIPLTFDLSFDYNLIATANLALEDASAEFNVNVTGLGNPVNCDPLSLSIVANDSRSGNVTCTFSTILKASESRDFNIQIKVAGAAVANEVPPPPPPPVPPIPPDIPTTPEPSSILTLVALGTLGAASTLKRKLKPSQLTEKETTKVS
jgi:hypothetical protein